MDQGLAGLAPAQRLLQRLTDLLGLQALVNVMADDLARERIRDEAQIHKRAGRRQVCDVGHPYLFGAGRHDLIRPGFQQIRMTPEAMMALSRLVVRPVRHDQQARGAQHVEQSIPSQLDAALRQCRPEQMMQLSCSEPRLAKPDVPHQRRHGLSLRATALLAATSLVIRLAADAHVAAGSLDAQLFDPLLRDDLPEGFFTVIP